MVDSRVMQWQFFGEIIYRPRSQKKIEILLILCRADFKLEIAILQPLSGVSKTLSIVLPEHNAKRDKKS